jgi:hypothetical protein
MAWARAVASIVASFGFCVFVGYLIGGWVGAVVLSSAMFALTSVSIGIGLRRRRRIQSERNLSSLDG